MCKVMETICDLVSIFTAENIYIEMCNIILCTYNEENQIYTLISTIVKAYIFACKYADKTPDNIEDNTGTKLNITKKPKD